LKNQCFISTSLSFSEVGRGCSIIGEPFRQLSTKTVETGLLATPRLATTLPEKQGLMRSISHWDQASQFTRSIESLLAWIHLT